LKNSSWEGNNISIFKEISPADIKSARSTLSQLIDVVQEDISGSTSRRKFQHYVTGSGVGPGVTSSLFQTIYDQDFTLQTSNAIMDVTVGLYQSSSTVTGSMLGTDAAGKELFPSSSLMMREKIDNYRQFAGALLGDHDGQFKSPADSSTVTDLIDQAFFIAFKRLFARDAIKRETFAMRFYQTATLSGNTTTWGYENALNVHLTSISGSAIYTDIGAATNKQVAFGGMFGTLVDSANTSRNVGLLFYDRGIAVLDLKKITSGSQFMSGTISGMTLTGEQMLGGGTSATVSASFIPDMIVSASIDNIVDHICSCRFQSGSQTAITFQNTTNINSTLVFCNMSADEFNYSSNPTYTDEYNRINVIDVGSEETQTSFTFVTAIGLYDHNDTLLAVAKCSRPIEKNNQRALTIRVRIDF
jgi:hypothetical protein